jgi:hypothetical protein
MIKDILQETDIIDFIKSLRLRWSKQISTAATKGRVKRRRRCKSWGDEIEEDLNIMGIKDRQAMARDRWEWWTILLETNVCSGL